MGQQQLLLIILVSIIVGIAMIIAVSSFFQVNENVNETQVYQSLNELAGDAQAYYHKPKTLGGGGRSYEGITFNHLSVGGEIKDSEGLIYSNEYGEFRISDRNITNFSIFAAISGDSTDQIQGIYSPSGLNITRVVKTDEGSSEPEPEKPSINNKWRR
jgi:hypothetical protein